MQLASNRTLHFMWHSVTPPAANLQPPSFLGWMWRRCVHFSTLHRPSLPHSTLLLCPFLDMYVYSGTEGSTFYMIQSWFSTFKTSALDFFDWFLNRSLKMFKERPYDTRLHSTAIAQSVTVIAETVGKRHLQPSTLTLLAALGFKSIQMLVFILPQHRHC